MNRITKILIFATIFLTPSYLIKFGIFGIPTNMLEILIYSASISYLLENSRINWKGLYKNYKSYILSIFLIFLGLILSTFVNQNYREGFGIIKGWFFDPLLFSFLLIQKVKTREDTENILKTFYFSAFIVSLIALQYFFCGFLTYDGRLAAFYDSSNYLAMFLAPAIFIGLYLRKIQVPNSKVQNFINIAILSIIIFVAYLTYSYAVWIAASLSLITVAFAAKKINRKLIIISFLVISIAFLTQINSPKLKDVFSDRSSLNSRIVIWKSSLKILSDNLVFGIGPGNFQKKYLEYQKYFPPYLEWAVPHPHNLYLAFWIQGGIIGFSGFLVLVYFWSKEIIPTLKDKKNSAAAVSLAIIIYFLIHGLIDTTYWKNDLSFLFWMVFFLGLKDLKIDSV